MMSRPSGEKATSAKLPWPWISRRPVPFPAVQTMTPSCVAAATRLPSGLNASRLTGPPPWSSLRVAPVAASSSATPSSVATPSCFRSGLSSTLGARRARCRATLDLPGLGIQEEHVAVAERLHDPVAARVHDARPEDVVGAFLLALRPERQPQRRHVERAPEREQRVGGRLGPDGLARQQKRQLRIDRELVPALPGERPRLRGRSLVHRVVPGDQREHQ